MHSNIPLQRRNLLINSPGQESGDGICLRNAGGVHVEQDNLSPASIKILEIISKNPGITAKRIAQLSDISSSNLPKYLSALRRKNLISVVREGRLKKHFAAGLVKLLQMAQLRHWGIANHVRAADDAAGLID